MIFNMRQDADHTICYHLSVCHAGGSVKCDWS